jgi:GntR family transcriptional regulator
MVSQTLEHTVTTRMTFQEIADDLIERIRAGEYDNADKPLPSYRKLADLYSVSVSTASRAYGVLHILGIITGEQGRGVFIADPLPEART